MSSDRKRNTLDALERMDYYGEANVELKTELPYTVELFARNQTNITRLNAAGITSVSAGGAGQSGTQSKVARAAEIEADIRLTAQTGKIIKKKFPEFQNTFILPRGTLNYDEIIHYAESFIADALPHDAKFSLYALNTAFFNALTVKVRGFSHRFAGTGGRQTHDCRRKCRT